MVALASVVRGCTVDHCRWCGRRSSRTTRQLWTLSSSTRKCPESWWAAVDVDVLAVCFLQPWCQIIYISEQLALTCGKCAGCKRAAHWCCKCLQVGSNPACIPDNHVRWSHQEQQWKRETSADPVHMPSNSRDPMATHSLLFLACFEYIRVPQIPKHKAFMCNLTLMLWCTIGAPRHAVKRH
jgi:hypothetical protein